MPKEPEQPWKADSDYFSKLGFQDTEFDFAYREESKESYISSPKRSTSVNSLEATAKHDQGHDHKNQIQNIKQNGNSIFDINTARLIKALNVEAKNDYINLVGKQYQFSDFLLIELNLLPYDISQSLRLNWQKLAIKFTNYSNFNFCQRQELIEEAKKFIGKIHFKKQFKLKQKGKNYNLDFREINLDGFDFGEMNLQGCNFSKASLRQCKLIMANLEKVDLSNANLSEANLCAANIKEANLSNSNLSEAKLVDADLSHANLKGANLSNANLRNAILQDIIMIDIIGEYVNYGSAKYNIAKCYEHPKSFTGYYSGYEVRKSGY